MVAAKGCRTRAEFAAALIGLLRKHLAAQRTAPYVLAEARTTEVGYRDAGGFHWIVGRRGDKVAWVSRDYCVYRDAIEDFDIDRAELTRRFGA